MDRVKTVEEVIEALLESDIHLWEWEVNASQIGLDIPAGVMPDPLEFALDLLGVPMDTTTVLPLINEQGMPDPRTYCRDWARDDWTYRERKTPKEYMAHVRRQLSNRVNP
jgi:hypothetical protein